MSRITLLSALLCLMVAMPWVSPTQAEGAAVISSRDVPERLVFGSDENFPPYEYLDKSGVPRGFNVDMVRAIGEAMGLKIEVELGPWAEIRRRFEVERTVHIADMYYSEQREDVFAFTEPFDIMHDQFYVRQGTDNPCTISNLEGREIIVEQASFTLDYLTQEAKGARLIAVESEPAALRLLSAGKHDCALVTQTVGEEAIRRFRLTNLAPVGPPVLPREYSLAVLRENVDLLEQLNQGLAIIKATGKFSEIYNKWFGQSKINNAHAKEVIKYAAWVLIPTLLVALGALLWSWSLRRLVAQRTGELSTELAERRRAEAELDYMATHDLLTGLPNRHALYKKMREWTGHDEGEPSFMLVLLDLDRFKEVNDTLGHQSGDHLLVQVAERLLRLLDERELLVRMGGDEFAIIRRPALDSAETQDFSQNLLAALDEAFEVAGIRVQIGVSIGIAYFPQHGEDASMLMRHADVAMYISKQEMCGYTIYDANRDLHKPERLALMAEIKNLVGTQQLILHYQPKFRLSDGVCSGVEALVRWQHPERGLIYPDSFIPLVEMSDLIRPFTLWVIDQAVTQLGQWRAEGIQTSVAVNISARNLLDQELASGIQKILKRHDMDASRLELEITETAIMADPVRSRSTLDELAAIGVHISVDDFGVGYSSLSYLQKLPVRSLKIDRSFVMEMLHDQGAREIVASVIDLAHNLELAVVAEGVEEQSIEHALQQLGCDMAQGYYYSRPQPAAVIKAMFASRCRAE